MRAWLWSWLAALSLALVAPSPASPCQPTPPGFTVAFLGDQGLGQDAVDVLELIRDEGADLVVHAGDFDYEDSPSGWEQQINAVLGEDFPYLATVGNHDEDQWPLYEARLEARGVRSGLSWSGQMGVASYLEYGGIFFVLAAPDLLGIDGDTEAAPFIEEALATTDCLWRVAVWHKNQHLMQAGGKGDETGWGVYEAARKGGAIVATAHEHSYSRTWTMKHFPTQAFVPGASGIPIWLDADDPDTEYDEGRTFAFVSGLGGASIRDQETDGPWFASILTSDQSVDYGALFCRFGTSGNPAVPPDGRLARCKFKERDGSDRDSFWLSTAVEVDVRSAMCGELGLVAMSPALLALRRRRR